VAKTKPEAVVKVVTKPKKVKKRDNLEEKQPDRSDPNLEEIFKLDNEIEYLESKMGIKNDKKKKNKEQK
jgi:hypothetical protein